MISTIANQVVAAIRPICPIFADEAETNRAPYAVYTIDEEALYDKDGIYAFSADVEIALCATSFDAADRLAEAAIGAIEQLRGGLAVKLEGRQPYESSEAKLFVVQLSYILKEAV